MLGRLHGALLRGREVMAEARVDTDTDNTDTDDAAPARVARAGPGRALRGDQHLRAQRRRLGRLRPARAALRRDPAEGV